MLDTVACRSGILDVSNVEYLQWNCLDEDACYLSETWCPSWGEDSCRISVDNPSRFMYVYVDEGVIPRVWIFLLHSVPSNMIKNVAFL